MVITMENEKNDGYNYDAEEMTVTLELDDGPVECAITSIFNMDGQDYIALLPIDENGENESGENWIYRYYEDENDSNAEPKIEYISDDDEYDRAAEVFNAYILTCERDELVDDEEE